MDHFLLGERQQLSLRSLVTELPRQGRCDREAVIKADWIIIRLMRSGSWPSHWSIISLSKNIQTRADLSSPLTLRVKPVQETQQRPGTRLDPELEAETGVRAERSAHVLDYILTSFVLPWIEKIQLQFLVTRTTHSSTCFFFFFYSLQH